MLSRAGLLVPSLGGPNGIRTHNSEMTSSVWLPITIIGPYPLTRGKIKLPPTQQKCFHISVDVNGEFYVISEYISIPSLYLIYQKLFHLSRSISRIFCGYFSHDSVRLQRNHHISVLQHRPSVLLGNFYHFRFSDHLRLHVFKRLFGDLSVVRQVHRQRIEV